MLRRQLTYGRYRRRKVLIAPSAVCESLTADDKRPWNETRPEDKFDLLLRKTTDLNIFDVSVVGSTDARTDEIQAPAWKQQAKPKSYGRSKLISGSRTRSTFDTDIDPSSLPDNQSRKRLHQSTTKVLLTEATNGENRKQESEFRRLRDVGTTTVHPAAGEQLPDIELPESSENKELEDEDTIVPPGGDGSNTRDSREARSGNLQTGSSSVREECSKNKIENEEMILPCGGDVTEKRNYSFDNVRVTSSAIRATDVASDHTARDLNTRTNRNKSTEAFRRSLTVAIESLSHRRDDATFISEDSRRVSAAMASVPAYDFKRPTGFGISDRHSSAICRGSSTFGRPVDRRSPDAVAPSLPGSGIVAVDRKSRVDNCPRNDSRCSNIFVLTRLTQQLDQNFREQVLQLCNQNCPLPFQECFSESSLNSCEKIGEGLYGEVFRLINQGKRLAVKVIPIDGTFMVNDSQQKTIQDILPEIVITSELSKLRDGDINKCQTFIELERSLIVCGKYPHQMLESWKEFDLKKTSENDDPVIFGNDQLFAVFEFQDGGIDLEGFQFGDATQALSVFRQLACSLAVAERELEFEHRDLHWGNILISFTQDVHCPFVMDGRHFRVATNGVTVRIIDFTLSRISRDGMSLYCDESNDEDLFGGTGDHQFEVYRLMRQRNKNNWEPFHPFTNVLWLWYVLDKLITIKKYPGYRTAAHKRAMAEMKDILATLYSFESVVDVVRDMTSHSVYI